jgi:hypothetical protein
LIKNELEMMKKKNQIFASNQIIQIESLDISENYEKTKEAIDRVLFLL